MRRLDPAQAAAARSDAPVQVTLAGPGSGKTSTLTGRFVHLTRQGVDPRRILAVTFTRKAADEMRNRIARLLELSTAGSLDVMTFHAFAFRLLKRNPAIAGLRDQFSLCGMRPSSGASSWIDPEVRHSGRLGSTATSFNLRKPLSMAREQGACP